MVFLQIADILRRLTQESLDQYTAADNTVLDSFEQVAISEIKGYLSARYSVNQIFYPLQSYDATKAYKFYERVFVSPFFYYATPPPLYDPSVSNLINDKVSFDGRAFLNISPTVGYPNGYSNLSYSPGDACSGSYWKDVTETATAFAVGTPVTDATKWTKADGRNQLIVDHCISIMIYKMQPIISYHNTPKDVEIRYNNAMQWLKNVASGTINADLPEIAPAQGLSIRYGTSQPKINHYY